MPKWSELERYLNKASNGWHLWKSGTHHTYYRRVLPNGEILTARLSRGSGEIPPPVWKRILKHQWRITEAEFNRGK